MNAAKNSTTTPETDTLSAALIAAGFRATAKHQAVMVAALRRVVDGACPDDTGAALDPDFGREVYGPLLRRAAGRLAR